MFLFTADAISRASNVSADLPFQQGEVYVLKYMGQPTIVTVQARTSSKVSVWFDTLDAEEFNQRVIFKLGMRVRFFGVWLPFVRTAPQTIIAHGMPDALGCDFDFWTHQKPSTSALRAVQP